MMFTHDEVLRLSPLILNRTIWTARGWKKVPYPDNVVVDVQYWHKNGETIPYYRLPAYAYDIKPAWELAEEIGTMFGIEKLASCWRVRWGVHNFLDDEDAPLAISKAWYICNQEAEDA